MALLYCNVERVKTYLVSKVSVADEPEDDNVMSTAFLRILMEEAEQEVEQLLSQRYAVPFQTNDGQAFKNLVERPTQGTIRTLCELLSVLRVLETDFGRGSAVSGEEYAKMLQKRFDAMVDRQVGRVKDSRQWKYPPLQDLRLASHNTESDDGYAGVVLHSTMGDGGFPAGQINDPSETFWNGDLDSLGTKEEF